MNTPSSSPAQSASLPDIHRFITPEKLLALVQTAVDEDLGPQHIDLTGTLMIKEDAIADAVIRTRQDGRIAGGALLPLIAKAYDPAITCEILLPDGSKVHTGDIIARFKGPHRSLLAMERVALNFTTFLSGIATLTETYVQAVEGFKAHICDTRKTIPGLRGLSKYAVLCGGGYNHRIGLFDAVLVKDNHLARIPLPQLTKEIATLIQRAKSLTPKPTFVEVEVDTLQQAEKVLKAKPDIILLDNMQLVELSQAVDLRNRLAPTVLLEASGGVSLKTVRVIAQAGVDRISIGALTHSAPSLDLGMDIDT
jgi:nicotinate-nucleotide pyrophosphorylase (carboxylating)